MEQLANHVRSLAILSLSSTLTGRPRLSMTTWTQKRVLKMFPTASQPCFSAGLKGGEGERAAWGSLGPGESYILLTNVI